MRRTKIVCTIGPASLSLQVLESLAKSGMNIVRLNGSHADLEWHKKAIDLIHEILPNMPILLDIPGRKIRTTQLRNEPKFKTGQTLILTTDLSHDGNEKVPINYPDLHLDLTVGDKVMADDGALRFTVAQIIGSDIYVIAENDGQLRSSKGINIPFVKLNTPQVTERDKSMVDFACENNVDFIGISFVESAKHLSAFREIIGRRSLRLVAKVENQGGLDNVEEVVCAADAIMIDRGDLSVETSLYDIAIKQKRIINVARTKGKPVIVATEMLHTMINNSFPTKSEVVDISNAVLDGCSATMLSGETAIGEFPIEAVITMRKVIEATESHETAGLPNKSLEDSGDVPDAISRVIPLLCNTLPITKVVAITRSGYAANIIARANLKQPIIAVSDDYMAAKSFNLIAGTAGVYSKVPFSKITSDHIFEIVKKLYLDSILNSSDTIIVAGISYPTPGSRMNTIQIYNIALLAKEFSW